ncbi:MAG: hypothetical protein ACYC4J_13825, partial [Gemmatimonadaceae bacterium]
SRRPTGWLRVEQFGDHLAFVVSDASPALEASVLPAAFPSARRIDVRELPLRELYLAVTGAANATIAAGAAPRALEEVA